MLKLRPKFVAVLLFAAASAMHAQSPTLDISSNPSAEEIQHLLQSNDSRLIAWGAYFASRNHDGKSLKIMSRLAEHWTPPPSSSGYDQDAMSEALYALIEQNATVPPKALSVIASSFPGQALILAARLPLAKVTPLLQEWYSADQDGNSTERKLSLLARVSAMMLSKAPPPGFAASILARSQGSLYIFVTNEKGAGMGGGSGGGLCGDGGGGQPPPGWPPLFFYEIAENEPNTHDPLLVESGGDRITWRPISISTGWGFCYYVRSLNNETRYHLLAAMLGRPNNELRWKLRDQTTIYWENNPKYLLDLQSLIHSEEEKFRATVKALQQKGLLTKREAATTRPKLLITISDHRKPPSPPLPQLTNLDPRTFYASDTVK